MNQFLANWGPVECESSLIESFLEQPLSDEAVDALEAIGSVETNSVAQLANALSGGVGDDPALADFFSRWAGEEADHGRLFGTIVARCRGESSDYLAESYRSSYRRLSTRSFVQRNSRLGLALLGALAPTHFSAYVVVFGAVQELSVIRAYELLSRRADDPRLTSILDAVNVQEGRHYRVYFELSKALLSQSTTTQRIVRCGLQALWKPVGYDAMGAQAWDRHCRYLCQSSEDYEYLSDVDRVVDMLPGLTNLNLMTREVQRVRSGAPSRGRLAQRMRLPLALAIDK